MRGQGLRRERGSILRHPFTGFSEAPGRFRKTSKRAPTRATFSSMLETRTSVWLAVGPDERGDGLGLHGEWCESGRGGVDADVDNADAHW